MTLVQVGIVTGILLAYAADWLLLDAGSSGWRWMFAVGIVPSSALLAVVPLLPESPRWLLLRGAAGDARIALEAVEGRDRAGAALREIETSLAAEGGGWSDLLRPEARRPLAVGLLLAVASVTVGINAVIFYGPAILRRGGAASASDALLGAIQLGGVNILFTLVAVAGIDRVGRKPLLLAGLGGMALSMALLGASFRPDAAGGPGWVLGAILAFTAFYAASLGPVAWVVISEIFPTRIRGVGMSACMVVMYLADFAVTFPFPAVMSALGSATFFVFVAVAGIATVFVIRCVPETRGRSLEEIQAIWSSTFPIERKS